jgi:hypothetical protein
MPTTAPIVLAAMSRFVGDATGDGALHRLDARGQDDGGGQGQPPQPAAEEKEQEQPDGDEQRDVGEIFRPVVGEPGELVVPLEPGQHPQHEVARGRCQRTGRERHPADEGEIGQSQDAEERVAVEH